MTRHFLNHKPVWLLRTIAASLLIACAFCSLREFHFLFSGQTTDAIVSQIQDAPQTHTITFDYFDLHGTLRNASDTVDNNWPIPAVGASIQIQYLPSAQYTPRLLGHSYQATLLTFFLGLCVLAGVVTQQRPNPIRPQFIPA